MPDQFLKKKIIKIRPEDTLSFNKLSKDNPEEKKMIILFYNQIQKYIDKKRIFFN